MRHKPLAKHKEKIGKTQQIKQDLTNWVQSLGYKLEPDYIQDTNPRLEEVDVGHKLTETELKLETAVLN